MFAYVGLIPLEEIRALNLQPYPHWLPEENILPLKQKAVCMLRYNNVPYTKISELLGISSPNTITRIIRLTAGSRIWVEGQQGGHNALVSQVIINKLKNQIVWKRKGLNCMKSFEARQIIAEEIEETRKRGKIRLREWHAEKLVDEFESEFEEFEVTDSIFDTICQKCGVYLLTADKLELLRRKCCNFPAIENYFNTISNVILGVEKKYLFNADETGLAAKRSFKVLTDDKNIHVTIQDYEGQHITCMCCFSAAGDKMDPFFIIPKKVNFPEELNDQDNMYLSTSENGWMTSHLWDIWCIAFVSFISTKRAHSYLDPSKPVILFVDGHLSRLSPFGMRLLVRFNIICIVYPSHSSHVLQPFDIVLAAPIKVDYLKALADPKVIAQSLQEGLTPSQIIRRRRILAFKDAWSKRPDSQLCDSFKQAGICPFDKEALAMKHLIADPTQSLPNDDSTRLRLSPINGKIATEHLELLDPYKWRKIVNNKFVIEEIKPDMIKPEMIAIEWGSGDPISGKIFNSLVAIFENGSDILCPFRF